MDLSFAEYKNATARTAVYLDHFGELEPEKELALRFGYLGNGLNGEAHEFAQTELGATGGREAAKEAGDVLWYNARLSARIDEAYSSLDLPVREWLPSDAEPSGSTAHYAAKVAEKCKKVIRGDDGRGEKLREIARLLACQRHRLDEMCRAVGGWDIQSIAELNAEKLFDRKGRGVLKGTGDNR